MAYVGSIVIAANVAPPLVVAQAAQRLGYYARPDASACTVFVNGSDEKQARARALSFARRFKPRGMRESKKDVLRSAEPVLKVARF